MLRRLSDLLRELDAQDEVVCVYLLRGKGVGGQWAIHSRHGIAPFKVEQLRMDEPEEDDDWKTLV